MALGVGLLAPHKTDGICLLHCHVYRFHKSSRQALSSINISATGLTGKAGKAQAGACVAQPNQDLSPQLPGAGTDVGTTGYLGWCGGETW